MFRTGEGIARSCIRAMRCSPCSGFLGLYLVMGLLFVLLIVEMLRRGPAERPPLVGQSGK
ncbi:MAG: hypothetical protein KF711_03930 [Nitrospira sp.]|nr:hypothetical protein [Nitrospira sp.]